MKRLIALLLAVGMVLSLAACGSSSDEEDTTETEETEETEEEDTEEEDTEEEETEEEEETSEEEEETEEEDSESEDSDDEEPVYGGTINCYYYNEFGSVYDVGTEANSVASFYTDYLWNIDWEADRDEISYGNDYVNMDYMVGSLAESWEVADDYSSITVTIRDDVYFQDKSVVGLEDYDIYGGRQLTADDVKYSYDRLLGLDGVEKIELDMTDWDTNMAQLDSVEVVDDYTVIFYLNTTDEVSVNDFICAFVGICGPEWDELTDEQKTDWRYASGTGPFIMSDFVNDNTATFTANPNYWGTDADGNQLPYVDEVNLIYMTDTATILASFISGEIDTICGNSTVFDDDQISQLEASLDEDDYERFIYTGDFNSLGFKQGDNPNEALTDLNVRMALQYATDTASISAYKGYTYEDTESMLSGLFYTGTAWCDVSSWSDELIESYTTYDPDYAMELLEEAGYADGFTWDITLASVMDVDMYSLVGEYLAEVGVTVNYNIVSTMTEMMAVGQDSADSDSVVFSLASASLGGLNANFGAGDCIHYNDADLDALFDELYAADNLEDQIETAKELDQTFMSQHYVLMVTYNKVDSRWCRSRVHGWSGEDLTKKCFYGYTMARCWVDDAE